MSTIVSKLFGGLSKFQDCQPQQNVGQSILQNCQQKDHIRHSNLHNGQSELIKCRSKVNDGQKKLPNDKSKRYGAKYKRHVGQSILHVGLSKWNLYRIFYIRTGNYLCTVQIFLSRKAINLSERVRSNATTLKTSQAGIATGNLFKFEEDFVYDFTISGGVFERGIELLGQINRNRGINSPHKQLLVITHASMLTGYLTIIHLLKYFLCFSEGKDYYSNNLNRSTHFLQMSFFFTISREPFVLVIQSLPVDIISNMVRTVTTPKELSVVVKMGSNISLTSKLSCLSIKDNLTEYIDKSILSILEDLDFQNDHLKFHNKFLNNIKEYFVRSEMDVISSGLFVTVPSLFCGNLRIVSCHYRDHKIVEKSLIEKENEELNDQQLYESVSVFREHSGKDNTFCEQGTQTYGVGVLNDCPEGLDEQVKNYNHKLYQENSILKLQLQKFTEAIKQSDTENRRLVEENTSLKNKVLNLKDKLQELQKEHANVLLEFGKLSVETAVEINKASKSERFQKIFFTPHSATDLWNENSASSSFNSMYSISNQEINRPTFNNHAIDSKYTSKDTTSTCSLSSVSSKGLTSVKEEYTEAGSQVRHHDQMHSNQQGRSKDLLARNNTTTSLPVEVQEARKGEYINLTTQPSSSTGSNVFNAYKLLLLTISNRLLLNDIAMLKQWACEMHAVQDNLTATEIVFLLDQKKVINSLDLSQLRAFFESLGRFDLIHLTDIFSSGDYDYLRELIGKPAKQTYVHITNSSHCRTAQTATTEPISSSNHISNVNNDQELAGTKILNGSNAINRRDSSNINLGRTSLGRSGAKPNGPVAKNTRGNSGQQNSAGTSALPSTSGESNKLNKFDNLATKTNHSGSQNCRAQNSSNANDQESQWLCSHYKRRCFVKFECCDQYWPCHRCHNNASTCGRKKLKSRDTTMVKCVTCGQEQQFGENGQFCVACNTQFADFYCELCKHLTGMDDHPYHCEKCGICRIHGDRSFHCDVCGVCLDVQLRGNHKCRPDSAHDGCGICLEDAFTGCQILPCSHKVHKHCANEMIQRGMTRCPICRESFAHKLQRTSIAKRGRRRK